ncbi:PREDICTED: wnt inhibitory factor 1-like [Papilio polytes]|uniref:wnt inhibitory factor 1-like n=1 Tax=Papilio polytes TaxID=76194 RepID=UPI000675CD91|nr:PREDICTED: wnt inhibitory factor 1-like [Papilio polytes]
MYLHAFLLLCGIYLSSAATITQEGSNVSETFFKESGVRCLVMPSLPLNSRRKCNKESCTVTCMDGYKFPDGRTVAATQCVAGEWQQTIPNCIPDCNLPCLNGGVCGSPNTCFCPTAYKGPQCQYSNCDHACLNGGTCVAKNFCQCLNNFHGNYCEFKNQCYRTPNLPLNARRLCSTLSCVVTCNEGYKFPDGSTNTAAYCVDSEWEPASLPDCM